MVFLTLRSLLSRASALQAAEDGPGGIKRLLLRAVDPGLVVTQTIHLDDLCSLLAGLLNSDLHARVDRQLATYLCQRRAVLCLQSSNDSAVSIGCLVPLNPLCLHASCVHTLFSTNTT